MASNKRLNAVITIGGAVASSLKSAFASTSSGLKGIGTEIGTLTRAQKNLGNAVQTFGRMGKNVDGLRERYRRVTQEVDRLRAAQSKLEAAEKRRERATAMRDKMVKVGTIATAAGAAIGAPLLVGTKEAKHFETEKARVAALGMGEETNKRAVEFAKAMKTFGTSQLENMELLRDGLSVFADLHHAEMVAPLMAKMKFGNKAVFGAEKGEQNTQQFMDMLKVIETRGGLKSEAEFTKQANIIQQVISATGGRVSATEWRNMLSTGGLAGKSMSSEALFYTMEHMVQEMGGDRAGTGLNSLYKSLYQGIAKKRAVVNLGKLGLIGDQSKVKHDKAGQTASMEPGALLGADMLRENPFEWMEKVLLPQLAKKGITDEKKVIDTIGMIVSNSVGGSFLAEMYRQRENIHRARARNMGAQNIDQLDKEGRNTAEGKQLEAEAKLADLKLRMGNAILPLYSSALETAASALEKLNGFTERNPTLTKVMVLGLGTLAGVLAIGGPLLIGLAALPMAINGASMALPLLCSGITMVGRVFATVGSALLLNPIGATITAIAVAALLIYKYWDPIKAFSLNLWGEVGGHVTTAWDVIKTAVSFTPNGMIVANWEPIRAFMGDLSVDVSGHIGTAWEAIKAVLGWTPLGMVVENWEPIRKFFGDLWADITGTFNQAIKSITDKIDWVGEKWRATKAFLGFGDTPAAAPSAPGAPGAPGASAPNAAATQPTVPFQMPPMATSRAGAAPQVTDQRQFNFHITPQPGQSSNDIADAVMRKLREQQRTRNGSLMYDPVSP
jgi:hypothetical protein